MRTRRGASTGTLPCYLPSFGHAFLRALAHLHILVWLDGNRYSSSRALFSCFEHVPFPLLINPTSWRIIYPLMTALPWAVRPVCPKTRKIARLRRHTRDVIATRWGIHGENRGGGVVEDKSVRRASSQQSKVNLSVSGRLGWLGWGSGGAWLLFGGMHSYGRVGLEWVYIYIYTMVGIVCNLE